MCFFDFDGDGKTGLFDTAMSIEAFELFSEYCDLRDEMRRLRKEGVEFNAKPPRNKNGRD